MTLPPAQSRQERASAEVEALLVRSARHYPESLPAFHPERLLPRSADGPDDGGGTLPAWSDVSGAGLDVTVHRLRRVAQDQARAALVSEHLGERILSPAERERLITRALDILPGSEEELFGELLSEPALAPSRLAEPSALLEACEALGRHYRPASALAYTMLVLAGNRAPGQLLDDARKLDRLLLRITSAPSVVQSFDRAARCFDSLRGPAPAGLGDSCFQARFGILIAVRDQLWALKPDRAATPFLLPQVLDCYLGPQSEVGNSLGLALVDAVVVGRLGFEVGFVDVDGTLQLTVNVEERGVAWETVRPSPLSFVPVGSARRLSLTGLFARAWFSLAAVHFAHGRVDHAIRHFEGVTRLRPDGPNAWCSLGACRLRRREPEQAVECYERALQCRADHTEALCGLGNAWTMLERWPRAIDAFKRAIAVRPDYVEAYNNLGFAFQHAGTPEQAVAAYEAAVEIRPDYVQGHFNLGNVALELHRYDEAVKHYREALRLQPGFAQAWYNMGQAHYGKRRLDKALHCYRRAVEVNPKHFGAWHNLGIVYRDKGDKTKAVEALEKAIAINPNLMR